MEDHRQRPYPTKQPHTRSHLFYFILTFNNHSSTRNDPGCNGATGARRFFALYPRTYEGLMDMYMVVCGLIEAQQSYFTADDPVGFLPTPFDFWNEKKASRPNNSGLSTIHHDHASGHLLLITNTKGNRTLQGPRACARLVAFWFQIGVPFVCDSEPINPSSSMYDTDDDEEV
mmetsp:Transcript_76656/g.219976  ORF Transcript_76656/g.219976 Transcript_76656/m.219976 type:complete len:173 (+) Transcript_76656:390-908(+)